MLPRAAALLAALCLAAPARADNVAAANALFDEGKRLMQAGRYAEACSKFADSQRLDPGVGTILNLASCYEKNGQTASAWSAYRAAAAAARDKGQTAREQAARDSVARLEPTLAKVIVTVTPQPDEGALSVTLDGVAVPPSLRGLPTPVDAGNHKLEASGTGKKTWSKTFTVAASATTPVLVPVLETAPVQAQAAATPAAPGAASPSPGAEPRDGQAQRTVALIVGGLGVVGVGVGTAFGFMAKSTHDDSAPHCNGDYCTDEGSSLRDSAHSKAAVSTVAFSIGGAGLLAGTILWLTAPRAHERGAQVSVAPSFSPDGAGLFARGSF
jgi:serine/threonine-protein kinase